jgi:hypothetical protein
MHLTESDIDTQIKKYWTVRERLLPQEFLEGLERTFKGFKDATREEPVSICEFLSYLDMGFAKRLFTGLYRREPFYPPEAMVKALFLMDIKRMKFYPELWRYLVVHQEYASMLGFRIKDGMVKIPSPKTLWHFDRIRMARYWDTFFRFMRDECVSKGQNLNLPIGRKVTEDATPIEALKEDSEAEYNAHYKVSGYKLDTVVDLETNIPLSKETIGINEDEAKCIIPHLKKTIDSGIKTEDIWLDGGYDDYPNLAWAGVHRIRVHHHIHENWVQNPKGEENALRVLYQKYWKHPDFLPKTGMDYILSFLLSQGEVEAIGAYFRNKAMDRERQDPIRFNDDYHLRNRQEGNHGYWKEHMDMEKRLRVKGRIKVDRYLTRNLCALLAVALCRLQHGIKTNLTSIAYFT